MFRSEAASDHPSTVFTVQNNAREGYQKDPKKLHLSPKLDPKMSLIMPGFDRFWRDLGELYPDKKKIIKNDSKLKKFVKKWTQK